MKKKYLPIEVSDASEILHLKLHEGTAFDYSLNSHPGTLEGTLPTYKFPGVDLPGTDEYISVADHADFTPALTPFSVSAWACMDSATNFIIASKGVLNTDGEWAFYVTDVDKLVALFLDESVADCYIGRLYNTVVTSYENKWTCFAMTYNGGAASSGVKMYINGANVDDTDFENETFVSVENLAGEVRIGRYDTLYANGKIDDLRIYSTERSAAQERDFYNQTRWRYGV